MQNSKKSASFNTRADDAAEEDMSHSVLLARVDGRDIYLLRRREQKADQRGQLEAAAASALREDKASGGGRKLNCREQTVTDCSLKPAETELFGCHVFFFRLGCHWHQV